jgi:hypothetical protein
VRHGHAQAVIFLYLQGSPSHIDLWDPKPEAFAEIRGEFRPIATRIPGIILSETLPLLAQQADKFALVRSIGVKPGGLANHGAAIYMLMTDMIRAIFRRPDWRCRRRVRIHTCCPRTLPRYL